MVEIGGKPILWHIMKIYESHNITDFVICCGYKGYLIKEFFSNYFLHTSDVSFDFANNETKFFRNSAEPWKVTLIDTGDNTQTGGRLKRVRDYISNEDFCFTYGDGVADVNVTESIKFHKSHGKMATVTAVQPPGRFGALEIQNSKVEKFFEKPRGDGSWINGGFFVLNSKVFDYIPDDSTIWEQEPMRNIAADGEMMAYYHKGFWQPMDTIRDKHKLEGLYEQGGAPWKTW
jgi:glucose-1-phosphate cytidylyltransferase